MVADQDKPTFSQLKWENLPRETHAALERKLVGLYGAQSDQAAFDYLVVDKQQALLMLMRRFGELGLWSAVARIDNVYGEGGVGMAFKAWPILLSALRKHKSFTSLFAAHHNNSGGFMETRRSKGSLHFCYVDGVVRSWEVHFDIYNPWASPINAWRHLLHEKFLKEAAHWTTIGHDRFY